MKMMSPPKMGHFLLSTTLLIVILVMDTGRNANGQDQPNHPACQTDVNTCGLGGHKLITEGTKIEVTLAEGSYQIKADAKEGELAKYKESVGRGTFKGCKVTMEEGFFVVHYDKKAATEGCAVDFITSKKEMANTIKFKASVTSEKPLAEDGSCLAKCGDDEKLATNENIVPFVFSQNNAKLRELLNGPIYNEEGKGTCDKASCKDKSAKGNCISFTALEIRWSKCGTGTGKMKIYGYLHQGGEPEMKEATLEGTNEATMDISGTTEGDGASFTYQTKQLPNTLVCMEASDKGIPVPKAWPIFNSEDLKLKDKTLKDPHLFVFHLLPQNATRKYGNKMMTDQSPAPAEGTPKCMKDDGDGGLSFKFPMDIYTGLLFTPPPPTTTPMPTTTTTSMDTAKTSTASEPAGEDGISGTTTIGNENGTTINPSAEPATTKPGDCQDSLRLPLIITAALLLVTTIGLIIVIIITCRKLNQAKAAGPIEDGDGAGSKKDEDDGEEEQEEDDEENNKTEEADGNKSLASASQSVVPASSEEPYSVDHLLAPPGWVRPPRGKTAPPPQFKSGGPYPGGYKMGYKG